MKKHWKILLAAIFLPALLMQCTQPQDDTSSLAITDEMQFAEIQVNVKREVSSSYNPETGLALSVFSLLDLTNMDIQVACSDATPDSGREDRSQWEGNTYLPSLKTDVEAGTIKVPIGLYCRLEIEQINDGSDDFPFETTNDMNGAAAASELGFQDGDVIYYQNASETQTYSLTISSDLNQADLVANDDYAITYTLSAGAPTFDDSTNRTSAVPMGAISISFDDSVAVPSFAVTHDAPTTNSDGQGNWDIEADINFVCDEGTAEWTDVDPHADSTCGDDSVAVSSIYYDIYEDQSTAISSETWTAEYIAGLVGGGSIILDSDNLGDSAIDGSGDGETNVILTNHKLVNLTTAQIDGAATTKYAYLILKNGDTENYAVYEFTITTN